MASEPKEDGLVGARPQVGYSACGRPLPFPGEVQRFRLMYEVPTTLHIRGRGGMKHYAGLDVSLEETSVCTLDETSKICREFKVASHSENLRRILQGAV